MSLSKQYDPLTAERVTEQQWRAAGVYHFDRDSAAPVYAIDTPPPCPPAAPSSPPIRAPKRRPRPTRPTWP